ncbi:MAG: DUF2961 domain-containing protein [Mesorhizobium sp.]|nr:MAG: DUF2961 domain-containing protein [Mesorhizobium sp.]TIX45705.1 MAG: DUF2961 domain-containing protein [Mesorhizobium sp.]TKB82128.1 MAG: DUF2961 domain-containing protein [Mesorhizobium sp.]
MRPARSPLEVTDLHAWPGSTVRPFLLAIAFIGTGTEDYFNTAWCPTQ